MEETKNDWPIGIFDSGMGGLTVLHELINKLPAEHFIYLGDTARLPYGTKSQETVLHYATLMATLLVKRGIKLLVVACNTATAAALPELKKLFPDLPIIGVIEPGARAALHATQSGHVALLATETTIHSGAYQQTLLSMDASIRISAYACGLFVALAEEGCVDDALAQCAVQKYLAPLRHEKSACDTVILGCTHFPVLSKPISQFLGSEIRVINSAFETAQMVANTLSQRQLQRPCDGPFSCHYLVTDLPERFRRLGALFLQRTIDVGSVELVDQCGLMNAELTKTL